MPLHNIIKLFQKNFLLKIAIFIHYGIFPESLRRHTEITMKKAAEMAVAFKTSIHINISYGQFCI